MKTYALIFNGLVDNLIVADEDPNPSWTPAALEIWDAVVDVTGLDPRPAIGWVYDGTTFAEPTEPEPNPAP